ncbi:FtsK/SpoIIIE domain-containing protein [Cellulosilyticum sp. I15G10I2]|uniref:FtsK/SpoIIIE domain-containing protein n=1 Tax=Cellulosilyticum sp. I15G10I2 TaxID=1892843 RepID=UPI00085C2F9C|nr:FtsK/SpoIIIE domain-containing protein [Cellulosilyticum sp. I15G10I2]
MSKNKENDYEAFAYMFLGGVGSLALSATFPFLLVPGVVATVGSVGLAFWENFEFKQNKMWENIGLVTKDEKVPICIKTIKTDVGEQKVYYVPAGLSGDQIKSKQNEIENALKKKVKIDIADNFNVIIQTFHKALGALYKFTTDHLQKDLMKFSAGYSQSIKGENIEVIDLNSSDCHMLISGTTGSGKSELLRQLLVQFILQTKGLIAKGELWIADLKGGVTTKLFSRASNCTRYTIFQEDTIQMMQELHEIMMKRYITLNNGNCVDYKEYNAKFKKSPMKPIVFVIEEYSLLFNNKAAAELLFLLLNLSRAANISVILTIQRPDFKTLDTRIKANLRTTICFKVKYDVDSEIVLGHGNYLASRELKTAPPGRGILNDEKHDDIIFQSLYMTTKEIECTLKEYLTKKATFSTYQNQAKEAPNEDLKKATKDDIKKIESLV